MKVKKRSISRKLVPEVKKNLFDCNKFLMLNVIKFNYNDRSNVVPQNYKIGFDYLAQ